MKDEYVRVSVAMAVYNGEPYIREQIDSILKMMGNSDELIISYDESTDRTLEIIKNYEIKDPRIRVVYDNGRGLESNFNNAVLNSSGEYIFLADQDDIWIDDKINKMVEYFIQNPGIVVLVCNGYTTNEKLDITGDLFQEYHTSPDAFKNFVKGSYLGCEMAFKKEIKKLVWPVSTTPPLPHDLWLGVLGAKYGKVELLDQKLILHRIHDHNYTHTSKLGLAGVIKNRLYFYKMLRKRIKQNKESGS